MMSEFRVSYRVKAPGTATHRAAQFVQAKDVSEAMKIIQTEVTNNGAQVVSWSSFREVK